MKWLRTLVVFDSGNVVTSADWKNIHDSYVRSIESIDFPEGSKKLKLRRKCKLPNGQWDRNGVKFLRTRFLEDMVNIEKWKPESNLSLKKGRAPEAIKLYPGLKDYSEPIASEFGSFDFVTTTPSGMLVAIEWETGNISSSHRSMNKLAIALEAGQIQAGVLIVPSRDLYEHLTDRIGNISELSGYLSMWKQLGGSVGKGLLAISVVEHDELTDEPSHPFLPAGQDGRAREGRSKRR
jgi:hypothetical protein